jgi:hypothetical protein
MGDLAIVLFIDIIITSLKVLGIGESNRSLVQYTWNNSAGCVPRKRMISPFSTGAPWRSSEFPFASTTEPVRENKTWFVESYRITFPGPKVMLPSGAASGFR